MDFSPDDWIIIAGEKRRLLAKVLQVGNAKDKVKCVLNNEKLIDRKTADIVVVHRNEILANLGAKPPIGQTAFGVSIEPFHSMLQLPPFGPVLFFREVTKDEKHHLLKVTAPIAKEMKRLDITRHLPFDRIEIRPKKGKHVGRYVFGSVDGDWVHHLIMRLNTFGKVEIKGTMVDNVTYIMWHEIGHMIWNKILDSKWKARWIRAYHQFIKISEASVSDLKSLHQDFLDSEQTVRSFRRSLADDDLLLFDAVLTQIGVNHRLAVRHLDLLRLDGEDLADYWPTTDLELSDMEESLSEYAETDPEEFHCEALAWYQCDMPMPKKIEKLVETELSYLRTLPADAGDGDADDEAVDTDRRAA